MDRVIPVGNENGDGPLPQRLSSRSVARWRRAEYDHYMNFDDSCNLVTRDRELFSRAVWVNGHQARQVCKTLSITRARRILRIRGKRSLPSPKLSQRVHADSLMRCPSQFFGNCSGSPDKAAAAVYNATVHAIPCPLYRIAAGLMPRTGVTGVRRQFYIETSNESRLHKFIVESQFRVGRPVSKPTGTNRCPLGPTAAN